MTIKQTCHDLFEKHKLVRRLVLLVCVLWSSASISVGLYVMMARELSGPDTGFLTAVVALMQVPVAYYFSTRGKQ